MRINRLNVGNFKRFDKLALDDDPRRTLLVGDNGAGTRPPCSMPSRWPRAFGWSPRLTKASPAVDAVFCPTRFAW